VRQANSGSDGERKQDPSARGDVADETQDMEGVGRFGWVTDPEGNRIELWQPV
jgi:predicted enzyme related to lactoylglutathione lyase